MPTIDEKLIRHKGIKKINVKRYTIFYTVDEMKNKVTILRVGHNFMDWEKYLNDK